MERKYPVHGFVPGAKSVRMCTGKEKQVFYVFKEH